MRRGVVAWLAAVVWVSAGWPPPVASELHRHHGAGKRSQPSARRRVMRRADRCRCCSFQASIDSRVCLQAASELAREAAMADCEGGESCLQCRAHDEPIDEPCSEGRDAATTRSALHAYAFRVGQSPSRPAAPQSSARSSGQHGAWRVCQTTTTWKSSPSPEARAFRRSPPAVGDVPEASRRHAVWPAQIRFARLPLRRAAPTFACSTCAGGRSELPKAATDPFSSWVAAVEEALASPPPPPPPRQVQAAQARVQARARFPWEAAAVVVVAAELVVEQAQTPPTRSPCALADALRGGNRG